MVYHHRVWQKHQIWQTGLPRMPYRARYWDYRGRQVCQVCQLQQQDSRLSDQWKLL